MLALAVAGGEAPTEHSRKVNEWLDDSGKVIARAFSRKHVHWIDWPGLGVFAFSTGAREVLVWPKPNARRQAIVGTFCRVLQPIILQAMECQALHASAAIGPAGLFAFCGRAGSGKSTLAFAMQQNGWRQFADDAVVLRLTRDRVKACRLPFTPGLRPDARAQFADLFHPWSVLPDESEEIPLIAVFLLQQDASFTSPHISPIPRARAFPELLAHAHCFDPEDQTHMRRLVSDYLGISARARAFTLEYPPNFQQLRQLTDTVVEAARSINPSALFTSKARAVATVA
jgi:hypothetical protein